uniref:Uncharacterized protein n=1 Tax=Romanomermis culicivorax TaxID=13658 RepID=A0A915IMC9_ROMCU
MISDMSDRFMPEFRFNSRQRCLKWPQDVHKTKQSTLHIVPALENFGQMVFSIIGLSTTFTAKVNLRLTLQAVSSLSVGNCAS